MFLLFMYVNLSILYPIVLLLRLCNLLLSHILCCSQDVAKGNVFEIEIEIEIMYLETETLASHW